MAISQKGAEFLIRSRLADAESGDINALFELGVTYSTGRGEIPVDLVEAHKWFNLAALSGCTRGQQCRRQQQPAARRTARRRGFDHVGRGVTTAPAAGSRCPAG